MTTEPARYDQIRTDLDAAEQADQPTQALPHLRSAAERLTDLIDESMARALVSGVASLRSAGASAGLSENAVGPRLARTQTLGAYANDDGRVTAAGVERARYDHETGSVPPAPSGPSSPPAAGVNRTPMRFTPRRTT